jgi:hypothetical protein
MRDRRIEEEGVKDREDGGRKSEGQGRWKEIE